MPPTLRCPSVIPSRSCTKQLCRTAQFRTFSLTPQRDQRITRARRQFFRWLNTQGHNFLNPASGHTNYMGAYNAQGQLKRVVESSQDKSLDKKRERKDEGGMARRDKNKDEKDEEKARIPPETNRDLRPFPLNPTFVSQPVLSDELREEIWEKVMKDGDSVRDVSASLGVEMSRVGAVVRLMEIEKEWERVRKPLARPYARAIMSMLPQTKPAEPRDIKYKPHESINDLPIHALTGPQIFHPTSESRHFTRADAAKVFDENLLPADDRVPHPELTLMHRDFKAGIPKEQMQANQRARDELAQKKKAGIEARRLKKLAAVKAVDTGRWLYRFTDVNVDDAGKDGRGDKGVGWRYGMPHMDRSRGAVKIPTRVG